MASKITTLLLTIPLLFSLRAEGQFLKADGKRIVNEKGENVLLRGMGLGGWMLQEGYMMRINTDGQQYKIRQRIEELIGARHTQDFYDLWLANHTRRADVDSMKGWGFNSIRLPMHYNLYTLPADKEPMPGKNTWLEKGFAITDSLLAWCKANRMYLILDLHAAPGGQGNDLNISDRDPEKPSLWESEENMQKTIALWKKLAERYADEPWIGGYDILNEPNWGFENPKTDKNGLAEQKNAPLRQLMIDITKAIRTVDNRHIIIIEGNGWGNNYNGILPPWDGNMVLSFHKYWAYNDPGSAQHMVSLRDRYNIPVWLGETGENSNVWFTEAVRLFENNNIGWAWWPLKKIGSNNPLEIRSNLNYDQVTAYLNGRPGAIKPKESNAYSGLMELATYARLENTIIHRDVTDAMFRQPFTAETIPFKANKIIGGTILNAVDYDLGRNGYAYFDRDTADYHVSTGKNTAGNRGRMYRNDGVDIGKDSTKYNSYYVSSAQPGEWLQYTVNIVKKGLYTLRLQTANAAEGQLSILVNGKPVTEGIRIPGTGGPKNFQPADLKNIPLTPGKQILRIRFDSGEFSLSSIQFLR